LRLSRHAGNRVCLLTGVAEVQQAWMEMVREAEHHLHLLFYIWRNDRVGRTLRDLLIERHDQGCRCASCTMPWDRLVCHRAFLRS